MVDIVYVSEGGLGGYTRGTTHSPTTELRARHGQQITMSLHNITTANAHCACSIGRSHDLS